MAKNPLYRNEYYFFSNMYDDSLITDFYKKITSESYDKSVYYQQHAVGRNRHFNDDSIYYKSSLGEFVIDNKYNEIAGLPKGTRTLKFNTMVLPIHDKRKYISTYGISYKKIPLLDFYARTDIFDKAISLQIGKYQIMSAYLIENNDKTITLAFTDGAISFSEFAKLKSEYSDSEPVWLFTNELTKTYYRQATTTGLISGRVDDNYLLLIPESAEINKIDNGVNSNESNSWDCLMSYEVIPGYDNSNLLLSIPCTYTGQTIKNGTKCATFSVPANFVKAIISHSTSTRVKVCFIKRPNRIYISHYIYSDNTSPVINLDYINNPTGNINLEVYETTADMSYRGRRLYDSKFMQSYFPNIYDFSKLNVNKSNLLIEVTEYDTTHTNQKMRNSIKPLIDSLGSDFYTEYVVNGYDKSLDGNSMNLKEYNPKAYPASLEDYRSSEYYGDYRGYILDKIAKTIESDPYLLSEYYDFMASKNQLVISRSGTPKYFRFKTGRLGEFSGSNKFVMNTSIASINPDDIQYFDETHSYISYYSSGNKCPANVYINGKYIRPTCTRYYMGMNYLFFPIDIVNKELLKYSTDEELLEASPIVVDFYPYTYTSLSEAPKDIITINSSSDVIKIFKKLENPVFSLNELVAYDNSTGKYLGLLTDIFNVNLSVSQYKIDHPEETNEILISKGEEPEYLMTMMNEIYRTMDNVPIIIGGDTVNLSWNTFIDSLIDEGVIDENGKSDLMNKKIDFTDIELTPKDSTFIGMNIVIYSRAFKQEYCISAIDGKYDEEKNETTYTVDGNVDFDSNRYMIFKDGRMISDVKVYVDNTYGGKLSFSIYGDNYTTTDGDFLVVHTPITYYKNWYEVSDKVFYMKKANTNETTPIGIWDSDSDTSGFILQSHTDTFTNNGPFENDINMKFSSTGLRLPPHSGSTNTMYSQYYSYNRAKCYGLEKEVDNLSYSYNIKNDIPLTDIGKQNPSSYENYNTSRATNPLDILLYYIKLIDMPEIEPDPGDFPPGWIPIT